MDRVGVYEEFFNRGILILYGLYIYRLVWEGKYLVFCEVI